MRIDLIEARMHASELTVNARAVAGSPFYEKFRRAGAFALPDLAWLRHNQAALKVQIGKSIGHEEKSV